MQKYLLIAVGGALGSVARFFVTSAVAAHMGIAFPFGTFTVNLVSCLIIGFLITSAGKRAGISSAWRFLIAVGFIGAFSTFSTFEWETYSTVRSGAFLLAALYAAGSLVMGLIAVWGGTLLAEAISDRVRFLR
jgi:CrcB protein